MSGQKFYDEKENQTTYRGSVHSNTFIRKLTIIFLFKEQDQFVVASLLSHPKRHQAEGGHPRKIYPGRKREM